MTETMKKVYLLDNAQFQELSEKIAECLMSKARRELKVQDERNRTFFGTTKFWFQLRDDGQLILCYDAHPSKWDVDAIKDSIEVYEMQMLIERGVF